MDEFLLTDEEKDLINQIACLQRDIDQLEYLDGSDLFNRSYFDAHWVLRAALRRFLIERKEYKEYLVWLNG